MDKDRIDHYMKKFKEQGYNREQCKEIRIGLEEGLDVSYYAKKSYRAKQMREMRISLEQGIDILNFTVGYPQVSEMRRKRKRVAKEVLDDLLH